MPRVSKKVINRDIDYELGQNLSHLISSLGNPNEIDYFIEGFFTKEEKRMIPKRLMLHILIYNNISDSEIKATLGISYETIRIYKNSWDSLSIEYKTIIEKTSRKRATQILLKNLNKKVERLDNFMKAKSNMKARSKVFNVE